MAKVLSPEEALIKAVFGDTSSPEAEQMRSRLATENGVAEVLKVLTSREREVVKLRYAIGDGHTHPLEEVCKIFRVTRERVRQMEAKALAKLRQSPK